jgi:hypothetical protein
MLSGTADPVSLAGGAPVVTSLATEPLVCPGAELLQVVHEIWASGRDGVLPPGLHPVTTPALTWSFMRAPESEFGAFTLAQTRVVCRSGVRSRGFHVAGFIDNPEAGRALSARWGYRLSAGEVSVERLYHGTFGRVVAGGRTVLDVRLLSPQPLSGDDLQYTDTMHLAETPAGLRLVQVEQAFAFSRAERGRPVLVAFDPPGWGQPRLLPSYPVSASSATADVTVQPVRFVCRPDVSAFEGTERVG